MQTEYINIIIAIFSAIAAISSVVVSIVAYRLVKETSKNQLAITLTTLINENKNIVADEYEYYKIKNNLERFNSTIENLLNVYDQACNSFLLKKINSDWFLYTYRDEIRKSVDENIFISQVYVNKKERFKSISLFLNNINFK